MRASFLSRVKASTDVEETVEETGEQTTDWEPTWSDFEHLLKKSHGGVQFIGKGSGGRAGLRSTAWRPVRSMDSWFDAQDPQGTLFVNYVFWGRPASVATHDRRDKRKKHMVIEISDHDYFKRGSCNGPFGDDEDEGVDLYSAVAVLRRAPGWHQLAKAHFIEVLDWGLNSAHQLPWGEQVRHLGIFLWSAFGFEAGACMEAVTASISEACVHYKNTTQTEISEEEQYALGPDAVTVIQAACQVIQAKLSTVRVGPGSAFYTEQDLMTWLVSTCITLHMPHARRVARRVIRRAAFGARAWRRIVRRQIMLLTFVCHTSLGSPLSNASDGDS